MTNRKYQGRPGPRPHVWITGPDPETHNRYHKFRQQRNQAQWRGEKWELPFEQWLELWGDLWPLRGVQKGQYCMSRRDWHGDWNLANCVVITRAAHAHQQLVARHAGVRLAKARAQ
tara:strand:+ start:7049 stop:7396 length:348 start_codon:yes stop_codon:yes gene_type:complete